MVPKSFIQTDKCFVFVETLLNYGIFLHGSNSKTFSEEALPSATFKRDYAFSTRCWLEAHRYFYSKRDDK